MSKYNFSNLVFSGWGCRVLKGIKEKTKLSNNIKKFAGTSIGSVFAALCAVRYTPKEMEKIIKELDFTKFADQGITSIVAKNIFGKEIISIKDIVKLVINERGKYGLNAGNFLESWVEELIAQKVGEKNATFRGLKGNDQFAELHISASNITDNKVQYFLFDQMPDMVVSKAVRTSSSFPIMYDVVKIDSKIFVDGGIYNNYPISIFNDENTLGVNILPQEFVKDCNLTSGNISDEFGWEKYVTALVTSTLRAQDWSFLTSNDPKRTIIIGDLGISCNRF